MQIQEILDNWVIDTKLDDLNLDLESIKVPILHGKYLALLTKERSKVREMQTNKKTLTRLLTSYYSGKATQDELNKLGREQFAERVLRGDIEDRILNDPAMIKLESILGSHQETVMVLEEILKSINNRGFQIKNVIEWRKLTMGMR
jgi:hypothetical protein